VTAADVSKAVNEANVAHMIEIAERNHGHGDVAALGRAIERRRAADAEIERLQAAIAQEACPEPGEGA
jgi:hypothetical protein